ncbi:MAG: GGDEF domain-containing phosphodiesterase [Bacilli bacterium]
MNNLYYLIFLANEEVNNDLPSGLNIVISIFVVGALAFLSYLLIKSVLKERTKYVEENSVILEGTLSKSAINSYITGYIAKIGKDNSFSLIYIELDNLTEIDDAFGSKEATIVVMKLMKMILEILPKSSKLSKYSKDSFLAFLPTEFDKMEVLDIAKRINEAISEPFDLFGETTINITASTAICYYPLHGVSIKQLINSLDLTIYVVKKNGGNGVKIYSDEISQTDGEYLEYYHQIKRAIDKKEFIFYYHPIVDIHKNTIFGAEALIRWQHPEHGLLTPNKFINIMEQSGDINWVGLWGLETLIKSFYQFRQNYPNSNMKFSMNISSKQLISETISLDFQKLIKKYKINPNNIILEFDEFSLFEKHPTVINNISKLHDLGFKIAIDGFGVDFATISQLKKMPVDVIKLSKAFLDSEQTYTISKFTKILVEFATENGIIIISEGIETIESLEMIKNNGITMAQGYLFAYPMSFEDLNDFYIHNNIKSINSNNEKEEI